MVTGTNNLDSASSIGGGTIKLTSGKKFDPTVDANVAVIGSGLATKNNLVVGSTFQAYNATFAVVGIYDAGNTFANSTLVMPLPTVQRLSGQASEISGAVAQVDSISNLSTVTTSIKNTLGSSADVVSQQDTSNEALAPLKNIKSISLLSLAGAVVSGAIIIFLTMLMIVRERRREIGVLKAIGSSNSKITLQFMTEAVTFTGIGAVIGLLIGVVAGSPVTKMMVSSSSNSTTGTASGALTGRGGGGGGFFRTAAGGGQGGILRNIRDVQPVVGWDILLYGLAAAIAIAIIGTFIAAYLTTKVKPAEVMRSE
jgi:putative ABC transport system permease protein